MRLLKKISVYEFHMFWFYIIILSSHIINGLLTGFARAILGNTGPWSFSTALASSGCTKTAVLYFSVWPSHPVNKPLVFLNINLDYCNCRSTNKKQLPNCIIFTLLLSHPAFAFLLLVGEINFNTVLPGKVE